MSRSFLEIDINHETGLPEKIHMAVLTGVRGTGKGADDKRLEDEEHVAFHFTYTIGKVNEVLAFELPREARKLIK